MRSFDLEERFVNYTWRMIDVVEALTRTRSGNYLASQLIRCCYSSALNYGEVQAAETKNDFIHKLGICFRKLKECRIVS
jgi:four helix bundle protein